MGIDSDHEHTEPPQSIARWDAAAGNPEEIECSVLFRATPQPRPGRWSLRSEANHRWQGILETTHRTSRRYEQHRASASDPHLGHYASRRPDEICGRPLWRGV